MKKKLFQYVTTVVLIAAVVMAQIPVSFAAESGPVLTTAFDAATATFTANGDLAKTGKKFVTVVIAPAGVPTLTATDLANPSVIVKTGQTNASGTFDITVVLPDSATEPRYEYTLKVADMEKAGMFSTAVPSDIPASAVTSVNSGGSAAIKEFVENSADYGLDDGNAQKDTAAIAKYISAVKPKTGYTYETLAEAYIVGEGLYYANCGEITLAEFFDSYSLYLENDYAAQYDALESDVKSALSEAFKNNDVADSFDKTYENNLFVAEYVTADNAAELKDIINSYMSENGISQAEHNSITNAVYKEKVYDELFVKCSTFKTLESIIAAYKLEVAEQKAAAKKANENAGGGGGGGGGTPNRGGATAGTITAGPSISGPSIPTTSTFKDVDSHWSKDYVAQLSAKGVINGFEDGSFKPDNNVTRAEFAKMLAQILGLNISAGANFADVSADSWYAGYVAAVANAGIVTGSDGKFMPDKFITRQDAAVMLARALAYKGTVLQADSFGFNDESSIADYAKESVNAMAKLGLITGYDGGFAPKDNTTRGQAAALLIRVADYIK